MARRVWARPVAVWQGRQGEARYGAACRGMAGQAGQVQARRVPAGPGKAGVAWQSLTCGEGMVDEMASIV